MNTDRWERRLRANRAEKDEFFAEDRRSPLDPAARESFDGLDYFPPDPAYRVEATVSVPDDPEPVELTAENGPPERFRHAVTFAVELPRDPDADDTPDEDAGDTPDEDASESGNVNEGFSDAEQATGDDAEQKVGDDTGQTASGDGEQATVAETLHGYRREGSRELFVPFRDKTTGQETYRGGRYMDLHPDGELTDGATVTLDFNLAYTPFCAFDDAFVCPLPPETNWLSVAVRAGERDPSV